MAQTDETAADPLAPILARMARWILPAATVPLLLYVLVWAGWQGAFAADAVDLLDTLSVTLLAAGVLVFVGTVVGATRLLFEIYVGLQATDGDDRGSRRRLIKHSGFYATLLVVNMPAVFLLGVVVAGMSGRSYVRVDNRSTANLTDITVVDSAGEHAIGGVPAGSDVTLRLKPAGDFELTGTLGEDAVSLGTFEHGEAKRADAVVTIDADRTVSARDRRP